MYVKLFRRIKGSSLMEEAIPTRYVFIMFLAIAAEDGYVIGSDAAIARELNIPLPTLRAALKVLLAPDPNSNSKDEEGRRLVPSDTDQGYKIVNYNKYKSFSNRDYMRNYMRDYRQKKNSVNLNNFTPTLTDSNPYSDYDCTKGTGEPCTGTGDLPLTKKIDAHYDRERGYHKDARAVLHVLNESSRRHFREVDANLEIISMRLRESGVDFEGVRKMIDRQCKRWLGTDQEEYLRPETLFRKSKFDSYYAAKDCEIVRGKAGEPDKHMERLKRSVERAQEQFL